MSSLSDVIRRFGNDGALRNVRADLDARESAHREVEAVVGRVPPAAHGEIGARRSA